MKYDLPRISLVKYTLYSWRESARIFASLEPIITIYRRCIYLAGLNDSANICEERSTQLTFSKHEKPRGVRLEPAVPTAKRQISFAPRRCNGCCSVYLYTAPADYLSHVRRQSFCSIPTSSLKMGLPTENLLAALEGESKSPSAFACLVDSIDPIVGEFSRRRIATAEWRTAGVSSSKRSLLHVNLT